MYHILLYTYTKNENGDVLQKFGDFQTLFTTTFCLAII